jgi:hypothetical protein
MAVHPWHSPLLQLPDDNAYIWFKTWYQSNTPTTGTYHAATKTITTEYTALDFPAYTIYKWKYY